MTKASKQQSTNENSPLNDKMLFFRDLLAGPGVEVRQESKGVYLVSSQNDDPWLLSRQRVNKGTYRLTAKIKAGMPCCFKVYLRERNCPEKFSEEQCLAALIQCEGAAVDLFICMHSTFDLRIDPIEHAGECTISNFSMVRCGHSYYLENIRKYLELAGDSSHKEAMSEPKLTKKYMERLQSNCHNQLNTLSERDYLGWILTAEKSILPSEREIQEYKQKHTQKNLISIVMPTYNTCPTLLEAAIESVKKQYYDNWELCIADDNSTNSATLEVLKRHESQDTRIRIVYRKENGHISACSNSALELATGDYVALLDHDDLLSKHALYLTARFIEENNEVALIYTDEDKIDEEGKRREPHFKPDFNQDLLFSQNYVSHLLVLKTSLLRALGGFTEGVEGSQDHDLVLRATKHIDQSEIAHLPYILYHWRITSTSTAASSTNKDYTSSASIKSLREHFCDQPNIQITAGLLPNTYRVIWPLPQELPLVSIIIPTRDQPKVLKRAVHSIFEKNSYSNYEIIIVDNQSEEKETRELFAELTRKSNISIAHYNYDFNYSAINNFAATLAQGSIVGFINNDIEAINTDWLTEMVRQSIRKDIGCVGSKLYYPNDTLQHGGVILGLGGVAGHSHKYFPRNHAGYFKRLKLVQNLSAVTAACLLIRRSVFDEVGGFNEKDLRVAFNDVDLCLRVLEKGYRNLWTPYSELYHHESLSRGGENTPEKIARFNSEIEYMKKTWAERLKHDPAYNPNLTRDREDYSISPFPDLKRHLVQEQH